MRLITLILIILITSITSVYSQGEPVGFELTTTQKDLLLRKLDRQWERLFEPELKKGASIVEVAAFALDAAASGYRQERLETALNLIVANINRSKSNAATYGNIFWYNGNREVKDPNAVEFCLRQTLPIWILYRDRLSPKAEASLREIFDLGTEGVKRHSVKLSYTNIILMKISNLIMLGEYYGGPELARMGYDLFEEWLIYTYHNGLCEYLSPGYYMVDLQNLSLIYRFTKNPAIRKMAAVALEYIWTDIAVNWYQPSQRLGGTHSRDYDRLYGHSIIDQLVAEMGWSELGEEKKPITSVMDLFPLLEPFAELGRYVTSPLPRFVHQRWGEADHQRATHYLGSNFSVGSAESNYNNMDKTPLVINLGGGYHTPVINFFMDGREDYYGLKRSPVKSGHLKALHLKPFLISVQNDAEVLFLASIRDNTESNASKMESVITLPSDSEIWLDQRRLDVFNFQSPWQIYPEANNNSTRLNIVSVRGRAMLRLIDQDKKEGIGVRRKFEVTPGKYYRLKVSAKGQGLSLYINFYDQNNSLIQKEHLKSIRFNQDRFSWGEITEQAPEGAKYCYVWLYSPKSNLTDVTVNDLAFEAVNEGHPPEILCGFDFREELHQEFTIPEQATIFIKRGDAVAALRLLKGLDVSGKPISFRLFNDGLGYGALRLTATHSRSKTGKRGMIIIWSYTTDGIKDDQTFSSFRERVMAVTGTVKIDGPIVNAKVKGITGVMELTADVEAEKRILRRGMKPGLEDSLIAVNGGEIGRKILEKLDLIQELIR